MKNCARCKKDKNSSEFAKDVKRADGLNPWCRDCNRAYQHDRHASDPNRRRNAKLIADYGITLDDYNVLLEQQGGVCAVCRQPNNQRDGRAGRDRHLHVDHDHETGKIRGLLCHACNIVLGLVKDDPDRLRLLANYLEVSNGCVSEA